MLDLAATEDHPPAVEREHDRRTSPRDQFYQSMRPLLDVVTQVSNVTDVYIDGELISVAAGGEVVRYGYRDFPGFTFRSVQAGALAAAVYAGVQFGPQLPALPMISVKLPPDLRVTVVQPPIGETWHMTIRFLGGRKLTLEDYVTSGIMTDLQRTQILRLLDDKKNMVVSGSTGAGKTTLLRALLDYAARDGERLVVIEDTPELTVEGENVVHLHTAASADMASLLRLTLRMSPDRIAVGEVRGPEALELVRACNTGHSGTLATIHSNGASEALDRLHTLAVEAQSGFMPISVRRAIDAVIQIEGRGGRRRVSDVWMVGK
jgi:type IV secretory pathway ATPase VirB11/archaellum biosynthesis ATPase